MEKLLLYFLYVILFVIYFSIAGYIYNLFIPFNIYKDVSIFFITVVVVPASVISGNKISKFIKTSPDRDYKQ